VLFPILLGLTPGANSLVFELSVYQPSTRKGRNSRCVANSDVRLRTDRAAVLNRVRWPTGRPLSVGAGS
jgi:hypothetical protein